MNWLVQQQLAELGSLADNVRDTFENLQEALATKTRDHEDLMQRYWGHKKDIAIRQHNEDDFRALDEENRRFRERNDQLRQRLEHILTCTKALSETYRP